MHLSQFFVPPIPTPLALEDLVSDNNQLHIQATHRQHPHWTLDVLILMVNVKIYKNILETLAEDKYDDDKVPTLFRYKLRPYFAA